IDGQDERAATRRRGALDQGADIAAVLHDVELEPERFFHGGSDVFNRANRHGRERVGNSRRLRGTAGENFAVAVLHAGQPDWGQNERERGRLGKNCRLRAAVGDVVQDALPQIDAFKIGAVGAQRLLGVGPRFAIIDESPRNLAMIALPQVLDTRHGFHGRRPSFRSILIAQDAPDEGKARQGTGQGTRKERGPQKIVVPPDEGRSAFKITRKGQLWTTLCGRVPPGSHLPTTSTRKIGPRSRSAKPSAGRSSTRLLTSAWRRPFPVPIRSRSFSHPIARATNTTASGADGVAQRQARLYLFDFAGRYDEYSVAPNGNITADFLKPARAGSG